MTEIKQHINNFLKYRYLLKELVKKDITIKYRRSVLGIFWSFLNPLLNMVILTIIFSTLFKGDIEYYPLYILVGRTIYTFYSSGTKGGMGSIQKNASIIKKVYVPKYIYCLSSVLSEFVVFLISCVVIFCVMIVIQCPFTIYILATIVPVLLLLIFITGVSMILTTINVFFRDMKHLYGVFLTMLMWGSAIFYPINIVPKDYIWIFNLNPVYVFIAMCRDTLIYGKLFNLDYLIYGGIWAVATLIIGMLLFKKYQDRFILYI